MIVLQGSHGLNADFVRVTLAQHWFCKGQIHVCVQNWFRKGHMDLILNP